jgi:hypothetical protein
VRRTLDLWLWREGGHAPTWTTCESGTSLLLSYLFKLDLEALGTATGLVKGPTLPRRLVLDYEERLPRGPVVIEADHLMGTPFVSILPQPLQLRI